MLGEQNTSSDNVIKDWVAALKDEGYKVRREAADSLVLRQYKRLPPDVMSTLTLAMQKDEDGLVRSMLAEVLGQQEISSPEMISALISGTKDKSTWSVRYASVEALGKQKTLSDDIISALSVALQDEDWHVRHASAEALTTKQKLTTEAIAALTFAAEEDANDDVKAAAIISLDCQKMFERQ